MSDGDTTVSASKLLSDPRVVTLSASSFAGTLGGGLVAPVLPAMATALAELLNRFRALSDHVSEFG